MLTIFKTNQPLANILLLFYLIVVRASTFIHPMTVVPKSQGVLTQWLYTEFSPTTLTGQVFAFFLVFTQAVIINLTVSRFRVGTEVSLLPGLFYCLVTSLFPEMMVVSPVLIANTFVILAMTNLFDVYKNNAIASRVFDAGFWLGLACVFYFPYLILVLWGIIGLGILRGIRPKEILMLLIGIFIPFFLSSVYFFWNDSLNILFKHFSEDLSFLNFSKIPHSNTYIKLGVVLLFVAITVLGSGQFFIRRNIAVQKYISIIYWLLLLGGITVLIQKGADISHLLVTAVPLGVLLSMLFQRIGIATAEVLHMLLLGIALIFQFEYLLA